MSLGNVFVLVTNLDAFLALMIHRTLYLVGIALSESTIAVFVLLTLLIPAGLVAPYTRTLLSNSVAVTKQAQIFAGFSAIESISTVISPVFAVGYSIFTSGNYS